MKKLLIVSDMGHFKAFEVKRNPSGSFRLELLKELDIQDAHKRLSEVVTDSAGLFGMGGERAVTKGYGEKHTLEEEKTKRIAKTIAGEIVNLWREKHPDAIYFSAPPRVFSQILDNLQPEVKDRIKHTIKADLTHHDKEDLIERFFS